MRVLILSALLLAACGGPRPRDPGTTPKQDAGATQRDAGTTPMDGGLCNLGLPSQGMVIERGTGGDYLLELENATTRVAIARYYVEWGVGESQIFRIGGMSVRRDDVDLCVTDDAKLTYENSHHNWRDAAELVEGGTRYRLELSYQFDAQAVWTYRLLGFDDAGGELFSEDLELVAGPMWP